MLPAGRPLGLGLFVVGLCSGAVACDGVLRPGPDPEGVVAAGGLPLQSGSCTVTSGGFTSTARWDQPTSTFTLGNRYWRLDAQARVVEEGATDAPSQLVWRYDDRGTVGALADMWQGAEVAQNSWDQQNSYDADGHLVGSDRQYRSGTQHIVLTYQYDGDLLTGITRDGAVTQLHWLGGRVVAREELVSSVAYARASRSYDRAGRLVRLDFDGAGLSPRSDGTADIRQSWSYDNRNRVVRFEQDGTQVLDAPRVDGTPDEVTDFDPACAAIAVRPELLYRLPRWLDLR